MVSRGIRRALNFRAHYNDVIMSAVASPITSVSIVARLLVQVQIKENFKAPRHWPLYGEFTALRSHIDRVSIFITAYQLLLS